MTGSNYLNLFLDAGISNDQEKYGRCLDAVLAQEGITVDDIVGLGERGTSNKDLYVVHRRAIASVWERGLFSKRMEVERLCPIASIARLRTTQEGFKPTQLTITAHDAAGKVIAKIVWNSGYEDWEKRLVLRQHEHLFKVISAAMDTAAGPPARPSVSSAWSKAGALREWAADAVKASGVEVTPERVEEHANMIAAGIGFQVFLRLGENDLKNFYRDGEMPSGSPIATFDDLYSHVIARVGSAQQIDQAIDAVMAGAWNEFVRGCREQYS